MADLTAGGVPVYRDSAGVLREAPSDAKMQAMEQALAAKADKTALASKADATALATKEATAENVRGAAFRYDATVRQDSTTNLATTIILTKTPRTLTVSLLGAVLNLFTNPAETAWVNIMSRAPS